MIDITGKTEFEAWTDGVLFPVERVRPYLWSVPHSLQPRRYVLVYSSETPLGVALVDAGWDTDDAWTALTAGLALAGYAAIGRHRRDPVGVTL